MKYILTLLLLATTATADELWVGGTEKVWNQKSKLIINKAVEVLNTQTTNSYETTNGTVFVTNYCHTADNTNNILWQLNFGYEDSKDNVWIWSYNTSKCGGFDVDPHWNLLSNYCDKVDGLSCGRGIGLSEFMADNGYTRLTNQWLTLSIPFVDDNKKSNSRKKQFKEQK